MLRLRTNLKKVSVFEAEGDAEVDCGVPCQQKLIGNVLLPHRVGDDRMESEL